MQKLEFRHIEVFREVILRGSASAAARSLGISQPAVSKCIAQAEHIIGFSLFDRRHSKLLPTSRAMELHDQSAHLFTTLERVNDIILRMASGELTPVAIGVVPLLATTLLPEVVSASLTDQGHIFEVSSHDSLILTNQVAAGQLEFALVAALPPVEGLESVKLVDSPMFCAVPIGHPLAEKREIQIQDLQDQPFIGLSTNELIQLRLDQLLRRHQVRPREVIRCPLMAGALAMAEAGIGLTFVDAFAARLARRDRLRIIPFSPAFTIELSAIWPRGQVSRFNRRAFLHHCCHTAQRMIREAPDL